MSTERPLCVYRTTLKNLSPNTENALIVGVIIAKQRPRKFQDSNPGSNGKDRGVWNFTLRDSPNDWINATLWAASDYVFHLDTKFQIGDVGRCIFLFTHTLRHFCLFCAIFHDFDIFTCIFDTLFKFVTFLNTCFYGFFSSLWQFMNFVGIHVVYSAFLVFITLLQILWHFCSAFTMFLCFWHMHLSHFVIFICVLLCSLWCFFNCVVLLLSFLTHLFAFMTFFVHFMTLLWCFVTFFMLFWYICAYLWHLFTTLLWHSQLNKINFVCFLLLL